MFNPMRNVVPVGVLLSLFLVPAFAAETHFQVGDATYTVRTGTDAGYCTVTVDDWATIVECTDGQGNMARADSVVGCLATSGRGFCAKGTWGTHLFASVTLDCGKKSYNLSTGNDNGSCTRGVDNSMTCDDGDGNSSSADCAHGCTSASGSGCCCKQGPGCSGGKNCAGR